MIGHYLLFLEAEARVGNFTLHFVEIWNVNVLNLNFFVLFALYTLL